ncbi:chromosome segregation protein SMC [Pectobacterium araliae]|uniref:AAA family ATPase n=1 Tax=Pectobacterium araliae TaxID=3073862 RepID=UPI0020846011|nr:AAA family ATPase [Pectobacterium sp. MAFF 302110]GKW20041.1 chromosome segregation protein SMC [Pectobacterium carotovorum subsp. carotovorum]
MNTVTKSDHLNRIVIKGYKSIADCDVEMRTLNILIGANGAGKSNFISFFRLITNLLAQRLQLFVGKNGGPDALLHFGRKKSPYLAGEVFFTETSYHFSLVPTNDNRMMFQSEDISNNSFDKKVATHGHFESQHKKYRSYDGTNKLDNVLPLLETLRVYHLNDTSESARVKQIHRINDNDYLREDGANLAAFLFRLQKNHAAHYQRIVKTIQMVAPFFGDFYLRSTPDNPDNIQLEWVEKDQDIPFKANELSDGTLRFIILATVLLQPETYMPSAIIIDEPELGLHPYAITVLAALIRSASEQHQLIVSTQSVELVNEFEAEDLIVVDKHLGASTFKRLDQDTLKNWLEDYSLGELWKKNILGGRPQR